MNICTHTGLCSALMRLQVQLLQQRIRITVTWEIVGVNMSGIQVPSNLLLCHFTSLLKFTWPTRDDNRSCVWASEKRKKTLVRACSFISGHASITSISTTLVRTGHMSSICHRKVWDSSLYSSGPASR